MNDGFGTVIAEDQELFFFRVIGDSAAGIIVVVHAIFGKVLSRPNLIVVATVYKEVIVPDCRGKTAGQA
jgi:hypothetical protein